MAPSPDEPTYTPSQALQNLVEGNRRYRDPRCQPRSRTFDATLASRKQRPFAVVVGCSDSRVPVEILFDQGAGELFVVRNAGHVISPAVLGSIEFAVTEFGSNLVVVLGHSHCGAVTASLQQIYGGPSPASPNICVITDHIAEHIPQHEPGTSADEISRCAVHAHVAASIQLVCKDSETLADRVRQKILVVVGAVYDLQSGHVEFAKTTAA